MQTRDQRIDFIKGILMWCVVYGHTINTLLCGTSHAPVWLHTFVRTFDMPFFMILSGYFLKRSIANRGTWKVFINRVSTILIPIVIWTLVFFRVNFWARYYFLWAVLVSSMLCIVGNTIRAMIAGKMGGGLEFLLYLFVIVGLHVVNMPWNLFYLFPFFVFGYYMRDVRFELSACGLSIMASAFVILLCFWETSYTPWSVGALAWKNNWEVLLIYCYRFVLGVVGVFVMAKFFGVVRNLLNGNSLAVRTIVGWGKETLALYILQSIFVECILRKVCCGIYKQCEILLSQSLLNLVGYVIAPIFSFWAIVALMWIIEKINRVGIIRCVFGFRVR